MLVENIRLDLIEAGELQGTLSSERPTISWLVSGTEENWFQEKYQIRTRADELSDWVVQEVQQSDASQFVPWLAPPLGSRESFQVSVRVKGKNTEFSDWSEPVAQQTGFLKLYELWPAKFVAVSNQPRVEESVAPESLFRKAFKVEKAIKRAQIFSTALGIYELEINGARVAADFLSPGWTTYEMRILHQTYDVTTLVRNGTNVIGARVGAGWYSGRIGFEGGVTNIYGEKRAVSVWLALTFEDGTTSEVLTDESWKGTYGPSVAGIYDGETYDSNKEVLGWSSEDTDLTLWNLVEIVPSEELLIEPQSFPHVTEQRKITAKEIITTPLGKIVLDFGENIVGFASFSNIRAPQNYKVQLKFAEVLEHGELGTRPLREAKATDTYIFKGDPKGELYTPRFTFHGFRYCQVDDPEKRLILSDLQVLVISTNMKQIGEFECDNQLLNQLHDNVIRSTRGNFITIPSDCPQRDERMGWTGDIAVFGKTAAFLFDCPSMLNNWLKDVWCEQQLKKDFLFPYAPPMTVPDMLKYAPHEWDDLVSAIWLDCTVYLPKALYDSTGATFILDQQYESMEKWLKCLPMVPGKVCWDRSKVKFQLGDWLDPLAPPDNPVLAMTDSFLVADAFLYLVLVFMREISLKVRPSDAPQYSDMAKRCKSDFLAQYVVDGSGHMLSDTQTAYALALCFGLFADDQQIKYAGDRLARIVTNNNFRIGSGFAGTPFVTRALFDTHHSAEAYAMLLQTECPSWLYPVTMGATTIWERWNSMMPDGTINPGDMTSFNHYALGAVASTMHEIIGGLQLTEPGYRRFSVKPQPGGGLRRCVVKHQSPYGAIGVSWRIENGQFLLNVKVPLNTSAQVELPDGSAMELGSGVFDFSCTFSES